MKKKWYVVYTKARNEKKTALILEKSGIDVYCPIVKEVRQWSDRKKTVEVPLFSSYLFVHLAPKDRELVYAAPGVVRYLFWLNRPAIVKDQEIKEAEKILENNNQTKDIEKESTNGDVISEKEYANKTNATEAAIKEEEKATTIETKNVTKVIKKVTP